MEAARCLIGGPFGYTPGTAPLHRVRAAVNAQVKRSMWVRMLTAEYAVGTVAACAFAAVLYRVVTGGSVVDGLSALVADALATLS